MTNDLYEVKKVFPEAKFYEDICWKYGIGEDIDSFQLTDDRTMQLIETFQFYMNSPKDAFENLTKIWWDSYITINNIYTSLKKVF